MIMTPRKNTNAPYPGMISSKSIEFFVTGNEVNVIHDKKISKFTELPFGAIQILQEAIDANKEIKLALHDMHPNSNYKRLEQFAKCRFGGLDFKPDIKNNKLQEGEYWPCPMHGNCEAEGTLCQLPKFKGIRLEKREVEFMQLLSSEMTNQVIAEELEMALGTFHAFKKKLYQKLNIQTKQGITIIAYALNLI